MQIFMLSVRESLREAANGCAKWAQKALQRLKHFVNLLKLPKRESNPYASDEIVEQTSVPKKRRSGSKGRKTGQTSRRNRVQRQAKGRSKKR
jgi:hypothetical protein